MGSRASTHDVAEALQLVARVQTEADLDAGRGGWGTDLSKFLAEVILRAMSGSIQHVTTALEMRLVASSSRQLLDDLPSE